MPCKIRMKIASGVREKGIVVGNTFNKYGSRNPIVRQLMQGFEDALQSFVQKSQAHEIHEVGCGEGYWTTRWLKEGYTARGSDFSVQAIDLARGNAASEKVDPEFKVASIYDLVPPKDVAELIVCCEVLEHLEYPEKALKVLRRLVGSHLIVSVPCEPVWRILNMVRGSYLGALGNTPGHIQHWSKQSFLRLIAQEFEVIEVRSPFPWTMVLAR
jgi:2-polyprenyl-3-methyl-5-hydroxy-6-metoxy-1,4-benzoquinol methylase